MRFDSQMEMRCRCDGCESEASFNSGSHFLHKTYLSLNWHIDEVLQISIGEGGGYLAEMILHL